MPSQDELRRILSARAQKDSGGATQTSPATLTKLGLIRSARNQSAEGKCEPGRGSCGADSPGLGQVCRVHLQVRLAGDSQVLIRVSMCGRSSQFKGFSFPTRIVSAQPLTVRSDSQYRTPD